MPIIPVNCNPSEEGFDDAFNKAQVARTTALRQLDTEVLQAMTGQSKDPLPKLWKLGGVDAEGNLKPFAIPSKAFLINNTDRLLTKNELKESLGISVDQSKFTSGVLTPLGLENAVLFADKEVRDIVQSLKLVDKIVYSDELPAGIAAKLGRPSKALKYTSDVGNFWRLMSTGFDWAFQFTLGLPLLFYNPDLWSKVTVSSLQAFKDPDIYRKMTVTLLFEKH